MMWANYVRPSDQALICLKPKPKKDAEQGRVEPEEQVTTEYGVARKGREGEERDGEKTKRK